MKDTETEYWVVMEKRSVIKQGPKSAAPDRRPIPTIRKDTHWQLSRKWNFPEPFDTDLFLHGGSASLDKQRGESAGNLCPLFV